VANLSLRPFKRRGERKRGERERGERREKGGEKGSTYRKEAATTLVCYNTSILQGGMALKSRD